MFHGDLHYIPVVGFVVKVNYNYSLAMEGDGCVDNVSSP